MLLFVFVFFCTFSLPETLFYSVFSKNAKLKETQKKRKKTLFVNTPVLTVLVKMSVFFCIFHFCCFWNFHVFQRCFLIGFQKSKITKYESNKTKTTTTRRNKMQSKNKSKIMIQNKARQQAEKKTKTEEQLERKKQNKNEKNKNQIQK